MKGGDEGVLGNRVVFETTTKLVSVTLPSFNTGTYANQDGPYDQTDYDSLVQRILDSIRPLR